MEKQELTRALIGIYGVQTVRFQVLAKNYICPAYISTYMQTVAAHLGAFILSVWTTQICDQEDCRYMREGRGFHPSSCSRRGAGGPGHRSRGAACGSWGVRFAQGLGYGGVQQTRSPFPSPFKRKVPLHQFPGD